MAPNKLCKNIDLVRAVPSLFTLPCLLNIMRSNENRGKMTSGWNLNRRSPFQTQSLYSLCYKPGHTDPVLLSYND